MDAALTGASGHLGANLVRLLLERGWTVRCLVHKDARALEGLPVERVSGDLRNEASLAPLVDGVHTVFHCAGLISTVGGKGGQVASINVDGVRHLGHAARHAGVERFVHVSSCHAFDLRGPRIAEDSPRPGPQHPSYDRSKAAGEAALRAIDGLDSVIVNPAAVLGPWDFGPGRIGRLLLAIRRGSLPAVVPGGFYFVDARDVSEAMLAARDRGLSGDNYLLGGHYRTMAELAGLAADAWGVRPPRWVVPNALAKLAAPAGTLVGYFTQRDPLFTSEAIRTVQLAPHSFDQSKAQQHLRFQPRPLDETVADACAWLARHFE